MGFFNLVLQVINLWVANLNTLYILEEMLKSCFLKKISNDICWYIAEGSLSFKSSSLSNIVSISEKPGFHNQIWLLELTKVLKPGGSVYLQEPAFFDRNKEFVSTTFMISLLSDSRFFVSFFQSVHCVCIDEFIST